MKETYIIEEIAAMSMLSTRTVRNYLSLGLLEGEKVDGAWRFTPEQFGAFLNQDMVAQSVRAKASGMVYDFLAQDRKTDAAVCAVIDVPVDDIATETVRRSELLERVNSLGLQCSYRFDKKLARLIIRGTVEQLAGFFGWMAARQG